MFGIELTVEGKPYVESALRAGLIINCTHEQVLRLLPPFIITERQVSEFGHRFRQVLTRTRRPTPIPSGYEADRRAALAASQ